MNAIILEDELIASNLLIRMINEIDPTIKIIKVFEGVHDLANYLLTHSHPDILILDIQVKDGLSLELFDLLPVKSKIIFATAYDQYAVTAFRKNAVDYLLKPIKKQDLSDSLARVKSMERNTIGNLKAAFKSPKNRFLIKFGKSFHQVLTKEIAYIYTENRLSYFILKNEKRIPTDFKLTNLMEQLDGNLFFQANRQLIVSKGAIKDIVSFSRSRLRIKMNPPYKNEIIVSTKTTPLFKEWLVE